MYCMKCGTQNKEEAKFCIKCGTPIGTYRADVSLSQPQNTETVNNSKKKKWLPVAVGILAIFALIMIFSGTSKKEPNKKTDVGKTSDVDISVSGKGFSLDAINKQCPGCEQALNTYIDLMTEADSLNSTKESIDYLCEEKYYQMQHNCTAEVIDVEDVPYAYRGSVGTYTGQWKGAGPSGHGTYQGSIYWSDAVSYTGDWLNGLPDGEGELYIEKFKGGWDMEYKGHMTAGMRDGTGNIVEYLEVPQPAKYRIYDSTVFQNDIICQNTECVEYSAETGEILRYYIMIGNENGWVDAVSTWGANELSPSERQALDIAECAMVWGTVGYVVNGMFTNGGYDSSKVNSDMLNELNEWRANKAAEEQESIERQKQEQEKYKNYCADQYDKLHAKDPSDWSKDAQYFRRYMY